MTYQHNSVDEFSPNADEILEELREYLETTHDSVTAGIVMSLALKAVYATAEFNWTVPSTEV